MRLSSIATWAAVLTLVVPLGLPSVASARSLTRFPVDQDLDYAPEGVQPGLVDADGRVCVKECPDDTLPCDPPAYKAADGRCSLGER